MARNDETNTYDGNEKLRHGEAAASSQKTVKFNDLANIPLDFRLPHVKETITEPLKGRMGYVPNVSGASEAE